jgi:hypothetical protein
MDRPRRGSLLARKIKLEKENKSDDFWGELSRRIKEGTVIPILSNTVRNDRIFDLTYDTNGQPPEETVEDEEELEEELTVDEQLAMLWAEQLNYPLPDKNMLARVAQYNHVKGVDAEQAKMKYLHFLKLCLLDLAQEVDEQVVDLVEELKSQIVTHTFSDIACQLEYPKFKEAQDDPLRTLAELPLHIYVTTSYYDFLERALVEQNKTPRSQICFWAGEPRDVAPEHRADPNFVPSKDNPLVYHLYGFEKYPESLVLSEDDYLDFLVKISQDTDANAPIIPLYLREALTESSLILLGYRLQDWDFRILFRGIINAKHSNLRRFSLAIQLDPAKQQGVENPEEAQHYLQDYFEPAKFRVEWGDTDSFIKKLRQEWNKWRQSQA